MLKLVRTLVTGSSRCEFDQLVSERLNEDNISQSQEFDTKSSMLRLVPMGGALLKNLQASTTQLGSLLACFFYIQAGNVYGKMLIEAILTHGILCLGIYRLLQPTTLGESGKRYVITNPPFSFSLLPTDMVTG